MYSRTLLVLILVNGAYGNRMKKICDAVGIPSDALEFSEDSMVDLGKVKEHLQKGKEYTLIAVVHCETSSGVLNPIEELGQMVKQYQPQAVFFVDAMSSFGAIPIKLQDGQIDYLVSSANKCLQGVPGFSFVLTRKSELLRCKGNARSLSLDLVDQYESLENSGQFRFTPPTHTLLAFLQALQEFQDEGGINGRARRYKQNCTILHRGMEELGFNRLLSDDCSGYIITSYHYPDHVFIYVMVNQMLSPSGQIIYPGKLTNANCFRIGNIGDLYPSDMKYLMKCMAKVLDEMNVPIPVPVPAPGSW
ncbi:2-aminoethylphosphonate--pyruvate transaminase [Blattella germanica]|nr:2-aminoethylphosphonate--pyruvate transaminase [Blattella germanica]